MRSIALVFVVTVLIHVIFTLEIYTNSWAVHIPDGSVEAERIAQKFGFINLGQVVLGSDVYHLSHRGVQRKSFSPHWGRNIQLKKEPKVSWFEQQTLRRMEKRQPDMVPTDPLFSLQWYLGKNFHLGIQTAWNRGYTGRGVVVTVVDDGLEKDHPDLALNYDPEASYDFNDNDPDPQPRYNSSHENHHGTRCAGVVAAVANNDICGAGVAYNARIGGVRMLDGITTDIIEAQSLSLNPQHIDIYSASWGPSDDGKVLDGPRVLSSEALYKGILNGRRGLGSIFVWSSGNGGRKDNCNSDGYANSIYTVAVGGVTNHGTVPWYSEPCACKLTSTYSSGGGEEETFITTDIRHRCTDQHSGTSAATPLAAGILALALEANPALTWRDIQHIVVRASSPAHLMADDWVINGVGRKVSHFFGYGLLHAGRVVELAETWETTQPQRKCLITIVSTPKKVHSDLILTYNVTACSGSPNHITSLEHVQAKMSLSYSRRGDLEIYLTSPMGTRSVLMGKRPHDNSTDGYRDWSFMTTQSWDENPLGLWTLEFRNRGSYANHGFLSHVTLILYGTDEHMMSRKIKKSVVRKCLRRDRNGSCIECLAPYYTFGKLCLSYCPAKYFKSTQRAEVSEPSSFHLVRSCAACHPSCFTCKGSSANNCTSCSPLYEYNGKDNSCVRSASPSVDFQNASFIRIPQTTLVAVIMSAAIMVMVMGALMVFIHWYLGKRSRVDPSPV
ncbi:proprotein convertase subtilisin/kexin type 4-like [Spea bombifrons]|uniref:proprotein convertase subtilisin/kexin type 4-like n=1 Tax=Spea bombifrons TaxID=233779 RepID=UPI002349CC40|nr:proprotein convertase subtilisin/kexin type 4-like [Spea bombifrons]XP_053308753.1 proprotein convertase subtilisin/kexin type 4-like [Spea bombifrons]